MFASDRDLLVYEPRLFDEVAFASQTVLTAAGGEIASDGVTLTVASADFAALGVDAGWVVVVEGVAAEVLERVSATVLTISRVRGSVGDAAMPLVAGTGLDVRVGSFRPQIGVVHEQVLRALGIGTVAGGSLDETSVLNTAALKRVECFGALHLVFSGAAALVGYDALLWQKAQMYLGRFGSERFGVSALVDTDGDGVADATRRMNVMQFVRRC